MGILHVGDFRERDPPSDGQLQWELAKLTHVPELPRGLPDDLALFGRDDPCGDVLVSRAQGVDDPGDREAVRPQALLIENDLDLPLESARYVDRGHTLDRQEPRPQLSVYPFAEGHEVPLGGAEA